MTSYSLGLQNCPHVGETSVERNLQLGLNMFPVAKETALLWGRSTYSKWYCKSFSLSLQQMSKPNPKVGGEMMKLHHFDKWWG